MLLAGGAGVFHIIGKLGEPWNAATADQTSQSREDPGGHSFVVLNPGHHLLVATLARYLLWLSPEFDVLTHRKE